MLAIDLCAGSGWAVACQWLGIHELGIEIMPEAIATRTVMGALTQLNRDGSGVDMTALPDDFCSGIPLQIAGPPCQTFSMAGNGEGRKALVEVLRRVRVFSETGHLERGGSGDPRTWLVLEPLRLAIGGMPTYIVWEQVPAVLPVWKACGEVLTRHGYSVFVGILHAEQYGVPQTRKRAFLIARRDGIPAACPAVTHSRYHVNDPARLDPDTQPWVSMAEALGWEDGVVGFPRRADAGGVGYRSRDLFPVSGPAPTVVGKSRSWRRWTYINGTGVNAARRGVDLPAPTIHFGARLNTVTWQYSNSKLTNGTRRGLDQPAPTVYSQRTGNMEWVRLGESRKVTVAEAATLQAFPADHPFQGSATKQYLQVGNAVPPLLAYHILRMFL